MFPGQVVRTGLFRKTPEINGTWKQYSGWKSPDFFPMKIHPFPFERRPFSYEVPRETVRKSPEKFGAFRPEYCYHGPLFSGVFLQYPVTFWRDPLVPGGRNHRPGYSQNRKLVFCFENDTFG